MAYIKKQELKNGFSAEYWRIVDVTVNKRTGKVDVLYLGYKDKATRQANGVPVTTKKFTVQIADIDISKDIFEESYKATKNKPEYMHAQSDCFFANAVSDN